jgi:hypothetical protein
MCDGIWHSTARLPCRGRLLDNSTDAAITGLRLTALQHTYAGGMRQWITSYGVKPGKSPSEFEMTQPPRGEFYIEVIPAVSMAGILRELGVPA